MDTILYAALRKYAKTLNAETQRLIEEQGEDLEALIGSIVQSDTVAGWNAQRLLISKANTIYVYTDYLTGTDENDEDYYIPAIKIGDGKGYLIDLPYVEQPYAEHLEDGTIHVTAEEKEFWNNKVRTYLSSDDEENLVFTVD